MSMRGSDEVGHIVRAEAAAPIVGVPVPWTLGDIARASLAALALLAAAMVVVVVLALLVGLDVTDSTALQPLALVILGLEALFILPAWWWGPHKYGLDIRWLGFRAPAYGRAALLTALGLVAILSINYLWAVVASRFDLPGQPDLVPIFGEGLGGMAGALLAAAVVAPVAEEVFFRGFMFAGMRDRWGLAVGVIVSSVIFAVFHLSFSTLIPIAAMGAVFAYLYQRTGSLWPPIILHAAVNFLGILGAYGAIQ